MGPEVLPPAHRDDGVGAVNAPRPVAEEWLDAVRNQPAMLRRIADVFTDEHRTTLSAARTWFWRGEYQLIVFTGMGASLYAAQAVVPSLNRVGERAVAIDASELLHHGVPTLAGKVAVVIVSQSGESGETHSLMRALKTRVNTLAVVCAPESRLARSADLVVDVPVPPDTGVAIQTYTATIAVLLLLAHVVAGGVVDRAASLLREAADGVERLVQQGVAGPLFGDPPPMYLVGSGPSLASAQESALLLQRCAGLPAQGLPPGQFRRGAFDALPRGGMVVLFAPQDASLEYMGTLAADAVSSGLTVTAVSNARASTFPPSCRVVRAQYPNAGYAPLVEIVPVQLAVSEFGLTGTRHSRISGEE